MKILFLTWQFPNFASTFILNEIVELIRQGHDVLIGSLFPPDDDIVHEDVARFCLLGRTYSLRDFVRPGDRLPGNLAGFLRPNLCGLESAFLSFAGLITSLGVEFIHADFANLGATAAMVLSRLTGIPYSFETHTLDLFVKFAFSREKLRTAAFITTESAYNKSFLCSVLHASEDKVYINRLCPNLRLIDELPRHPKQPFLLCSVCRLSPIKGLDFALRAIDRVRSEYDVRYHIVGKGEQELALRALVQELDLGARVRFCGPLSNALALTIVQQSSIFVLPCVIDSFGDRDGTPTAIAEAMYLETPVISSNICGIPEMVAHEQTGILTDPGDVDALAEGLRTLLGDPGRSRQFAISGREYVTRVFDPRRSVQQLVALFASHAGCLLQRSML